jgi:hypothetical protein
MKRIALLVFAMGLLSGCASVTVQRPPVTPPVLAPTGGTLPRPVDTKIPRPPADAGSRRR